MENTEVIMDAAPKPIESTGKQGDIIDFFKDFYYIIRSPSKGIDRINNREPNLLRALVLVLISSAVFLGGLALYGAPIYGDATSFYNFYSTNFLIEQYTSLDGYLYFTFTTHSLLIFLKQIFFWIKIWVIFGLSVWGLSKIMKIETDLERTLEMVAWSMFPWLAVSIIFIPIMLLICVFLPAYAYVIYFPVVVGIVAVLSPCLYSAFIYKKYQISSFKSFFPYILTLMIFYAIWLSTNTELWFHAIIL